MDNNIENYKIQIAEYKNAMLNDYKNLIVCYENLRQLHESILQQYIYEDPIEPIKCSGIYAQNNSATVTRWALINLDGTMIYQSDRYTVKQTCKIDLRNQNRLPGIQFYLKANTQGNDSMSNIVLEYDPTADFVKFEVRGTVFNTWINYKGTTPAPPQI